MLVIVFLQDEPDQSDAPGTTMAETSLTMLDEIAAAESDIGPRGVSGAIATPACAG